jgi:hypothetical protein
VVEEANLVNFNVSNAYVGDELLIFSELYGSLNLPAHKVTLIDGEKSALECDFVGQRRHCRPYKYTVKNGCSISEVNTDLSLSNLVQEIPVNEFNLIVGQKQRAISPALVTRNGLYFRVKINEADLNNKTVQIRVGNQQLNKQFPYVRKFSRRNHGGGFCMDKVKDWTEGRSATKTYFLKSKIIRNGVIR